MAAVYQNLKDDKEEKVISERVIRRLPRYYRFLGDIMQAGTERISSRELSEKMGVTASQIRQDLNCFGGFGQQGYGYNVTALHHEIGQILGQDSCECAVLIGVGNLGTAVASYMDDRKQGFVLCGIFDSNPEKIGKRIGSLKVRPVEEIAACCREYHAAAAILCLPKHAAREVVPFLVENGIRGILNFSHYDIAMDFPNLKVENVHISDSLMTLRYKLDEK